MPLFPREKSIDDELPFWKRPIRLDANGFFSHLCEAAFCRKNPGWQRISDPATGSAKRPGVEALIEHLLLRAMSRAFFDLLRDYFRLFNEDIPEENRENANFRGKASEARIEQTPIILRKDFLDYPEQLDVVPLFQQSLLEWLACFPRDRVCVSAVSERLPSYFAFALDGEIQGAAKRYEPILSQIWDSREDDWRQERVWKSYYRWFNRELNTPLFGEAGFGVAQAFVWPRAWFEQSLERQDTEGPHDVPVGPRCQRSVVDLADSLDRWLDSPDTDVRDASDLVRVVCGEAGAGTTSFLKMYTQRRLARGDRILYIPLHLLDIRSDLVHSVESFCNQVDCYPRGQLHSEHQKGSLLLVFDGLDQLTKSGAPTASRAVDFVDNVKRTIDRREPSEPKLRVLIGGRPIAVQKIQTQFEGEGKILHLAPFYLPMAAWEGQTDDSYTGNVSLMDTDQRLEWWERYGELTGEGAAQFDRAMNSPRLDQLTRLPLNNYLITQISNVSDLSEVAGRNQICSRLVDRIWHRDWNVKSTNENGADPLLSRAEFHGLLREIGLAAWHERGHLASAASVERRCLGSALERPLQCFKERYGEGGGGWSPSFFFQKSLRTKGIGPAFEFVQKCFAEYFTSCRIVDTLVGIQRTLVNPESVDELGDGWDEERALLEWLQICGPAEMTSDLKRWIAGELEQRDEVEVGELQETLARLINETRLNGMPCEKLTTGHSFRSMANLARNAETALLVMHSCCARKTGGISSIDWPERNDAASWCKNLQVHCYDSGSCESIQSLNHLDFEGQHLPRADFFRAELAGSNFSHATLSHSILAEANMDHAILRQAVLSDADLQRVNLDGAMLAGADLSRADLSGANLAQANLDGATLVEADLGQANLNQATLAEANLKRVVLAKADLTRANLVGADLGKANLRGATLAEADLAEANLELADLNDSNLTLAELSGAILSGADLTRSTLTRSNFTGATLCQANLFDATLVQATLTEANLSGANLSRAELSGANLEGAILADAVLTQANLAGANLQEKAS